MELNEKKVLVVGLGASGRSAAVFLKEKGAHVKVTDSSDTPDIQEKAKGLTAKGIDCELGGHTEAFFDGTELIVASPGVSNNALPIRLGFERGIQTIGELELGYRFCEGRIIAVTGTNGKSTVVSLIGEIFKNTPTKAFVCGNIGVPFTSVVSNIGKDDVAVLEVSSFQLERIEDFRSQISVMLNITEDHLDRYADFNEYMSVKMKLFKNQQKGDCAIVNYDQVRLRKIKGSIAPDLLYFSCHSLSKEHDGAYLEKEELVVRKSGRYIWLAGEDTLELKGTHNIENCLAAGLACFAMGVDPDAINTALREFKGLSHRFEFIGTVNGVKFVDDSKATNVDSVNRALQSSPKGVMLIAGGKDKGGDYAVLAKQLKEKVKSIFLIGEAKEKISGSLSKIVPTAFAEDLNGAVKAAFEKSKKGDTILLSPMCSSFDMFKDYKERGEVFQQAVKELEG